jgi:hypothetical protein
MLSAPARPLEINEMFHARGSVVTLKAVLPLLTTISTSGDHRIAAGWFLRVYTD